MKREAFKSNEADNLGNLRFLRCDIAGGFTDPPSQEKGWAASPFQCMDKAVEGKPKIIVFSFGQTFIPEREALCTGPAYTGWSLAAAAFTNCVRLKTTLTVNTILDANSS